MPRSLKCDIIKGICFWNRLILKFLLTLKRIIKIITFSSKQHQHYEKIHILFIIADNIYDFNYEFERPTSAVD